MTAPAQPTLYELLGVAPTASPEEIRAAYRRLMRAAHPDTGGTAGLFRAVQLAYDTLIDPSSRAAYDAHLRTGSRPGFPTTTPRPPSSGPPSPGSSPGSAGWSGRTGGAGAAAGGGTGSAPGGPGTSSSGDSQRRPPRTGHSSYFRPMERPPRAAAARVGAIFDPPLFPDDETAGGRRRRGMGPLSFGRNRGPSQPRAATDILPMQTLRARTIGEPGAGVDHARLGGRAGILEEEAARRTDELVEAALLPAYPAMRLIHDLRDPASRAATIDHAVVIGDRAILIDSIMVEPGSFTWDGSSLTASGAAPALTLPRVIEQARLWLDPWRVSGVTVLHSTGGLLTEPSIERVKAAPAPANPRPGGRSAVRGGDPEPTTVLNPTELMDFLREAAVLEARTHVVNVRLLRAVLQLRPDARPRS